MPVEDMVTDEDVALNTIAYAFAPDDISHICLAVLNSPPVTLTVPTSPPLV